MNAPARKPKSSASRVAAYRQRMRAKGFVQRAVWTWDTKSPEFIAEAKRQSQAAARDAAQEAEIHAWLDQVRAEGSPDTCARSPRVR